MWRRALALRSGCNRSPEGLRHDGVTQLGRTPCARLHEERREGMANLGREHALEILERRSSKLSVVRMQAAKRNVQRLSREDQRQKRENVREALAGTIPHELVERGRADESVRSEERRV